MNFIPMGKYSIVKKKAQEGDENAKNFLGGFMEMSDEEANDYLNSLPIGKDEINKGIEFLIKDENEAIDGYDKQIKLVQNSDLEEGKKSVIIATLQHIKDEELEHIEELRKLQGGEEYGTQEQVHQ